MRLTAEKSTVPTFVPTQTDFAAFQPSKIAFAVCKILIDKYC
jgi:hypothetical protein